MRTPRTHPPFVRTVFDLSFTRFVAPRLIPLAYVLGLFAVLVYALSLANFFAYVSSGGGGAAVIAAWIVAFIVIFFIGAVFVRIQLETVAVAFRIYEHVVDPSEGPVD